MRIAYIAPVRLPTEKAHGAQIMKACEAFAREGVSLSLYITDRKTPIPEGPYSYYGVSESFSVIRISTPALGARTAIGYILSNVLFGERAYKTCQATTDLIYGRDEFSLFWTAISGKIPFIWESHDGTWNWFARYIAVRAAGIVVVTAAAKEVYVHRGISAKKIHVAPNGIDIEQFLHPISKQESREGLGIPKDALCILYIGRLDGWKGVDTLLTAADFLPESQSVYIVGGEGSQIADMKMKHPRVQFLGPRPFKELANVQAAADVLVVPNTARNQVSVSFTSPLKLIAHLASGCPIVASDLPSIREIVDEKSAFLVTPDSPEALASGIQDALLKGGSRARVAKSLTPKYRWESRAKAILEFITTSL